MKNAPLVTEELGELNKLILMYNLRLVGLSAFQVYDLNFKMKMKAPPFFFINNPFLTIALKIV